MKTYAFYEPNGRVKATFYCSEDEIDDQTVPEGCTRIIVPHDVNPFKWRIANGEPVQLTDPPNEFSYFDFDANEWKTNLSRAWASVRFKRDEALLASDWTDTLTAKARIGDSAYEAWQTYRQALRDITNQSDPLAIQWPVQPT